MERAFSRSCDGGTAQSGAARLARLVVKERRCERDAGATGGEAAENAGGRAGEGRGGFQAWVAAEGHGTHSLHRDWGPGRRRRGLEGTGDWSPGRRPGPAGTGDWSPRPEAGTDDLSRFTYPGLS